MLFSNKTFVILVIVIVSTITAIPQSQKDSTAKSSGDSVFVMKKSPWTAVGLSAICPGLGQIYNHSYWKAPIVWGLSAWFMYNYIQNNKNYKNYANLYAQKEILDYKRLRDNYHDQRDQFAVYMGLTYLLTMVDCYVDAQLFYFNVDENFYRSTMQLNLRVKF